MVRAQIGYYSLLTNNNSVDIQICVLLEHAKHSPREAWPLLKGGNLGFENKIETLCWGLRSVQRPWRSAPRFR